VLEINQVYQGDCLDVMKQLPDNFTDVTITSPPYNMGDRVKPWLQTYKVNNKDNRNKGEYFKWIKEVITELLRINRFHIFFNIQEVVGNNGVIQYIYQEFNPFIKEVFIWAKTNPPCHIVENQCSNGYEYIFCISKDNPNSKVFNHCNFKRKDYIRNVIIKGVHRDKHGHNYAFPEWLPEYFINYFTKKGDLIFDPMCGSGTTLYVAKTRGYRYLGIDISKEYVQIAQKRLSQETLLPLDVKQEGGKGIHPTSKEVGILPKFL